MDSEPMTVDDAMSDRSAKDYLVFALDVPSAAEARPLVQRLNDAVGMFKIGLELFVREGPAVVDMVRRQGASRIFLDLKLHDIPATVRRAMAAAAALEVDFVTVHCGDSAAMIKADVEGAGGRVRVLGVTVLTSVGPEDLRDAGVRPELAETPGKLVLARAEMAATAGCAGVVCAGRELEMVRERFRSRLLTVVPGIRPGIAAAAAAVDDQRRVVTPAAAIEAGADYVVVGRPIRDAADPRRAAEAVTREIARALATVAG
jgi:orotidine-5'-phosphate decarboxylase